METAENTPRELLSSFYEKYNLEDDGGFRDSKVKLEITKGFYFYIPNSDTRRKALLKHDIHHIITGYKSNFKGETEISSWEIASGCKKYCAAWVLDTWGMLYGFWFNLPGIFHAFVRGRRSKNLYYDEMTDEAALNMPIPELQQMLHLPAIDAHIHPTIPDYFLFLFCLFAGGIFSIVSTLLLPPVLLYNFYLMLKGKF